MSSVTEVPRIYQWLDAQLSAASGVTTNAPGGIWQGMAPAGTATPYVVFSWQGGADVIGVAAVRLMVNGVAWVRVIGRATEYAAIVAAADAIDTALTRKSGAETGATIITCYREQPLMLDSLQDGELYSTVGGLWRIQAVPS